MRYFRAYQFIFDRPDWLSNLLMGVVCQLIPVVGPLVWVGYGFEIVEIKHRRGDQEEYPAFQFDRFGDYLGRGVWPFLVQLLIYLPVSLIIGLFCFMGFAMAAVLEAAGGGLLAVCFMGLAAFVLFAGSFLVGVVGQPVYLRAGLSQDFGEAFSMAFLRDFLERTWKEMLLGQLFLMGTGSLVMFAGMAACCVGVYPAVGLVSLAAHHIHYQVYELYLERGGTPIPLKGRRRRR